MRQENIIMKRIAFLAVAAVTALAVSGTSSGMASTAPTQHGLYTGPIAASDTLSKQAAFSKWLRVPITYATDYLWGDGWNMFDPNHLQTYTTGPWGKWKAASVSRKLVLGVPLLVDGYAGNFDYVTSGQADGSFRALAQSLVANGLQSSVIRLGWEPNVTVTSDNVSGTGDWSATTNPAGYIAAYRHVVQLLRSYPGQHFTFDWTVAQGYAGQCSSFDACYPGDDVTDTLGLDTYDVWWNNPTATAQYRWNHTLNGPGGLADHRKFARAHGKPESVPEWGLFAKGVGSWGGGGDDPLFVNNMATWMSGYPTAFQSYFDISWAGSGVLADNPNGSAAYKTRFGH